MPTTSPVERSPFDVRRSAFSVAVPDLAAPPMPPIYGRQAYMFKRTFRRFCGNTGSNPVRVASIVGDGGRSECITYLHNKCTEIRYCPLTCRDGQMHLSSRGLAQIDR